MESIDIFGYKSEGVTLPDHDELCAIQAGQLVDMGCLEYETAAYACAYLQNGKVYYYISSHDESIRDFCKRACLAGMYHTPIRYFVKRYDLIEFSEEELNQQFRYATACQMKESYPEKLFQAIEDLTAKPAANSGYAILQSAVKQLENRFDSKQLQLFEGLLVMLFEGRIINTEAYQLLQSWVKREYEKMAIEPVKYGTYKRRYAGFAYEDKQGKRYYFADAVLYTAEAKQEYYKNMGYLVTPILTVTYYADSYMNPVENKAAFMRELKQYLNDDYMRFIHLFAELEPTIDVDKYNEWEQKIIATGKQDAVAAFAAFGRACNVR